MTNTVRNLDPAFVASAPRSTGPSRELGKGEFLQLLVAQVRNQDPLKPMEDKEFIAELAQFSALEETQKINANLAALWVGLEAKAKDQAGREVTGVIEGVEFNGTTPLLLVSGERVRTTDLLEIRLSPRR